MTYRTLLVEDHPTMRETLCEFMATVAHIDLIGAAADGEEALLLCARADVHLALIDVSLPGMSGIDLVAEIHRLHPEVICLMLSGHQEISYVQRALASGAQGYVLKGDPSELLDAIEHVVKGQLYLSTSLRDKLASL